MRLVSVLALALVLGACGTTNPDPAGLSGDGQPRADDGGSSGGAAGSTDGGVDPDGAPAAGKTLADEPLPPFVHAPGSGLNVGIVSGRIYDDLAKNADDRMRDLAALGLRLLRIEIEQATSLADYAKIVRAAKRYGIEVLALVTQSSLPGAPDPMAGTRGDFDATFVPAFIAEIDKVTATIPELRYVEVWNEPDVYSFQPFYSYAGGNCSRLEGANRYALLTVRVFETMNERRKQNKPTPTLVAFDFSHQDDTCVLDSVIDAQPIASHRAGYRAPNGLADGLPTDIVSIHGYGLPNRIPGESGYTYAGGTFADGVSAFLGHTFADGKSMIGGMPVWYTEVGWCLGSTATLARQSTALTRSLDTLRSHPQITAAFIYSYRDDEGTAANRERCGLRDNSSTGYEAHPSYGAMQAESVEGGDVVAPAGAFSATLAGASIDARGWAIDADGKAPTIDIAIDGDIVSSVVDGATPDVSACKTASSARCPAVGFAAHLTPAKPLAPGNHEIAARAKDASGNARVIGRTHVIVAR